MEFGNSHNFGPATLNVLLGAVMGEKVTDVLPVTTQKIDPFGFSEDEPTVGYDLAVEIGVMFKEPAKNPQELLERVMILVPEPNTETTKETLDEKFKRHDAFKKANKRYFS